ncbi:M16 family metallopeptidase [Tsuneonella sp. HG222]
MRRFLAATCLSLALAACAANPAQVASAPAAPAAQAAVAPLSQLVAQVDIPYETFTLANGLRVIVHTDRKAPVVGVTTYYRVGSKHEPRGKTGFAHLYEHLFFGGSENLPNFDIPLEGAGSTPTNGSTSFDRTNYVETVPTGALELALFAESDRMGHLLGALSQDKLDKQRSVVKNEKRDGDNQPYGLAEYKFSEALFPVGHPYRHNPIGSTADLDAATLGNVRDWYRDNYGPNNAILALTGDIDVATARPLVEKWFGHIARGPQLSNRPAGPVALSAPVREEMTDQVPVTRIYRTWSGPGLNDPDAPALSMGMYVLGGLGSSRLDNALVRGNQSAVSVTASAMTMEDVAWLQAVMDVKPGVDLAQAERDFGAVIDRLVTEGPTADELRRAATRVVSAEIGSLEVVGDMGGKGATLAEGLLYSGDAGRYRKDLQAYAALTPADVRAALQRWLTRPAHTLVVKPGERTESGEAMGGWGDEGSVAAPPPDPKAPVAAVEQGPRREAPPVAPVGELAFPAVETATLSNGIPVRLARRSAIPKLSLALTFDAGEAADGAARAGTQSLMMDLLEEGTTSRDAEAIAIEQERLGASIVASTGVDESTVSLTALTANLAPSLDLLADMVRNPAFAADVVARVKDQRLAEIAQEQSDPGSIASRAVGPLVFGPGHPYGSVGSSGLASAIEPLTPADIRTEHDRWLRPDNVAITAVGDVSLAALLPALEAAFGDWRAPTAARPAKNLAAAIPPATNRLVVIDRPNAPQSVILMARAMPLTGRQSGLEALTLANEVAGGGFLSRLMSDLREEKGWTYGLASRMTADVGPRTLYVYAPVQADRTADSIRAIQGNLRDFSTGARGVESGELLRVTDGNVRGLPNSYQTNGQVLGALLANRRLGRADDYQRSLPGIYRSIDAAQIDAMAARYLSPADMVIIVVGDRKAIEGQLATLGLPVEYRAASEF